MIFQYKYKFSLCTYAIVGITISILIFIAIIMMNLNIFNKIDKNIKEDRKKYAKVFIINAIQNIKIQSTAYLKDLSNLKEFRSQLVDNTYYLYWKENKLKEIANAPKSLISLNILDHNGKIYPSYINDHLDTIPLYLLNDKDSAYTVCYKSGKVILNHYYKIRSRNNGNVKAYLYAKYNIIDVIYEYTKQNNIKINNLSSKLKNGCNLNVDNITSNITFDIPEFLDLRVIMTSVYYSWISMLLLNILLISLILFIINKQFSTPIKHLSQYLDNTISTKECNIMPIKVVKSILGIKEIEKVGNAFNNYQKEICILNNNLEKMAYLDSMTKVFNRRKFDEDWKEINRNQLDNVQIILFDCNNFKSINDTYGHDIGDKVIETTAKLLNKSLRDGDDVYRIGGDEFCVILKNANIEDAIDVANRCMLLFAEYNFYKYSIKEPVTISAGISSLIDKLDLPKLLVQADTAMYYAKQQTSNNVQVYNPSMDDIKDSVLNNRLINTVMQSIKAGKNINMVYQKIESLTDKNEVYYESLVRILHNGEIITPNKILPIIKNKGMECEFDCIIIISVMNDILNGYIKNGSTISINISGESVLSEKVMNMFEKYSYIIKRVNIVIELTENDIIPRVDIVNKNLNRLKLLGYKLALDDFGSGYSSLRYLVSLPIDTIKFDITMVNDLMEVESKEKSIIENVVKMIKDMGAILIAEGIENQEMLDMVKEYEFDFAQGYYIHMPSIKEEINEFKSI